MKVEDEGDGNVQFEQEFEKKVGVGRGGEPAVDNGLTGPGHRRH